MGHDSSWFSLLPIFHDAQKWVQEKLGLSYLAKEPVSLQYIVSALFVIALVLILVMIARRKWKNTQAALVPDAKFTAANFFEILARSLLDLMNDVMGPKAKDFVPLIGSFAVFIFFSNILGLIPNFLPPTTNLNVTLACGLIVFLAYHTYGLRENWRHLVHEAEHHGHPASVGQKLVVFPILSLGKYFSHFANPVGAWWGWFLAPLLFPIELISHFARPMSLALRLLGNMTGDHVVLGVFLGLVPILVPVPFIVLGAMVCVIQTLVFCLLSTVYIAMAVTHEEH
jgi:F-type H+-transporting ATPase subunit a